MARNTSISLGDHFAEFIDQQVATGRYNSASEVVHVGLRLLQEHEAEFAALRQALVEGEQSGPALEVDVETCVASRRRRTAAS